MAINNHTVHRQLIGVLWSSRAEADTYQKVVQQCLEEPDIARRLGKRSAASAEALHGAMATQQNAARALEPTLASLTKFRQAQSSLQDVKLSQAARRRQIRWDWRSGGFLVGAFLAYLFGPSRSSGIAFWCVISGLIGWLILACAYDVSRRTLGKCIAYVAGMPLERVCAFDVRVAKASWESELRVKGVRPLIPGLLDFLIGGNIDELLLADSYDGLRTANSGQFVVSSASAARLAQKMDQMDGGTIAICGPRGSGKTTLLESCVRESDFAIFAAAPATFTPQEFLVSLFVKLCETYMESQGVKPPNLSRLTTIQRVSQRLSPTLKRIATLAAYAIPAALMICLGTYAALRTVEQQNGDALYSHIKTFIDDTLGMLAKAWRGESVGLGLILTAIGVMTWKARDNGIWISLLIFIRDIAGRGVGCLLIALPVVSCFRDPELIKNLERLINSPEPAFLFLVAWLIFSIADPRNVDGEWEVGNFAISKSLVLYLIRALSLYGAFYVVYSNPLPREIVTDNDNPVRALSVLAGFLVLRLTAWRPQPRESKLVSQCRDQIYRLRTVQNTTSTLTSGTSQIISMGSSHATSVTSVPPNFPDIVASFRELLSVISYSRSIYGKRTIIAIDELDRLGDDAKALAFLSEVKAIFGVPKVYYLISVAEDVGAAFVRRGMPYRDATDSSLDDVVHVQPGTLEQSTRILQKRAPGISDPYIMLVHGLSGGIARDLVRYGRRVMEAEIAAGTGELALISRQLILEELHETLSGFRVLLAAHDWTESASPLLSSFRRLMQRLRSESVDFQALHRELSDFAERRREFDLTADHLQLPPETRRLILEASAYAYYSLTMLDIFGAEGFTRRSQVAALHLDGAPQLLAEARQELAVSPYTAIALVRSIRCAWSLPVSTIPGPMPGQRNL